MAITCSDLAKILSDPSLSERPVKKVFVGNSQGLEKTDHDQPCTYVWINFDMDNMPKGYNGTERFRCDIR
jgi:hypothetical protein